MVGSVETKTSNIMKKNFLAFAVIVIALVGIVGGIASALYIRAYVPAVAVALLGVIAWPTIKAAWNTLNS